MKCLYHLKLIFFLLIITPITKPAIGITYLGNIQLGDNIAEICLAKILSLKYNIPFLYYPKPHTDLFVLHDMEDFEAPLNVQIKKMIEGRKERDPNLRDITNEQVLINNKENNVLLFTSIKTKIDYIDPAWILEVKKMLQLREIPVVNEIPNDVITVAVHIRKGNGGGQYYDGEQRSQQLFKFDRSCVSYLTNYYNYPFEWPTYTRPKLEMYQTTNKTCHIPQVNTTITRNILSKKTSEPNLTRSCTNPNNVPVDSIESWQTKFPPDQYYVDQIKKLSSDLNHPRLYVQIFTDDKNPEILTDRVKTAVNLSNITFHYENNRDKSFRDQMAEDLYNMSRFDVLIRSQSYFARIAEIMGDHKMVIYPLNSSWSGNKLIMNTIVINGSIERLIQ